MSKDGTSVQYVFEACGWDRFDRRSYTPDDGTIVVKIQPFGCPKNGTMNHCYIATLEGEFLGLVHQNSLRKATKADQAKAAETVEQRFARLEAERLNCSQDHVHQCCELCGSCGPCAHSSADEDADAENERKAGAVYGSGDGVFAENH